MLPQAPSGSQTEHGDAETDGVDSDDDNDLLKSAQVGQMILTSLLFCSTIKHTVLLV